MSNTAINNTIINLETEMAKAMIQRLVDECGAVAIIDAIKKGIIEPETVQAETSNGNVDVIIDRKDYLNTMIPSYRCGGLGTNFKSYDKKMENLGAFEKVKKCVEKLPNIGIKPLDDKGTKRRQLNNLRFAEFIVTYDKDGEEVLSDILNLLVSSGDWADGFGITKFKMEMLWHCIMLHKERKEEVIEAIHKILLAYDLASLRTIAHEDDEFRHRLNIECIMTCWLEKQVCNALNMERKFEIAA